jgi:hypothetical protein
LRLVTYLPSRPANGPSFTLKTIDIVGSSTLMRGSANGAAGSAIVSPMPISSAPAMQTISPAPASFTSTRFSPSKA